MLVILFRIGQGYDAHRLTEGRKLILGGVEIAYQKGLMGHSDADVLTHALIDALLGAAALGDIGGLFPDTDASFLNICSLTLLERVVSILIKKGYRISNADMTVLAQRPKLSPYIDQMRDNLALKLQTDRENVSVKATTEEGMGFTGSGEGMAAHAVVLLIKKEAEQTHDDK